MRLPVLTAADGAAWEAGLVVTLKGGDFGVTIVRRCLDIVDLLAVAASGQGRVALVSATLRRLDADAVDRLTAADVVVVGVVRRDDAQAEARLHAMGIRHVVPDDADGAVVASVIEQAVSGDAGAVRRPRGYATPSEPTVLGAPGATTDAAAPTSRRGSVIAVWGPTGGPGRTTIASCPGSARRPRSSTRTSTAARSRRCWACWTSRQGWPRRAGKRRRVG
jgi:hypothetical protein